MADVSSAMEVEARPLSDLPLTRRLCVQERRKSAMATGAVCPPPADEQRAPKNHSSAK